MEQKFASLKLAVDHNELRLVKNIMATERTINGLIVNFDFRTPEWDELTKSAVFIRDGKSYVVLLDSVDECFIPWECLESKGKFMVGVFGLSDITQLPTNYLEFTVAESCVCTGEKPADPTPEIYEQILALCGETNKIAQSVKDDVNNHNVSADSHNDIRLLIADLDDKIGAIDGIEDIDFDQLSEVVNYIKDNKKIIEDIEANKVSVSDIINNLTTNETNKPLSAAQGVVLKALIDKIIVPTKTSDLDNDSGYLTEHRIEGVSIGGVKQEIINKNIDLPAYPTSLPASDVYPWAKGVIKPVYTASEVAADAIGTADHLVSSHNLNDDSHNDIRLMITDVANRLNALADSDDETLDQMSEIVTYIKSNKDLIDNITTNKISYSDIVDDIVTNVSNKPLSAAQGVALKNIIDSLSLSKINTSDIVNNLTTESIIKPLSAHQGVILKALIDGISDSKINTSDIVNNLTTHSTEKPLSAEQGVAIKSLIDSVTNTKINTSDIANNLTTNSTSKVLSAAQGVALKNLINAITVPSSLSELATDSTHRLVTDAEKSTWNRKSNFSGDYADLANAPVDHMLYRIVSDDGWTRELWNSGKYICYGTFKETCTNYTEVNGFYGYHSSDLTYPAAFNEVPMVLYSCKVGSGFSMPSGDVSGTRFFARCYALSTASGEVECTWSIYAIGKWK